MNILTSKFKNVLHFGDVNLYIIIFFLLFISISSNVTTALHLLLTAELLWITLYLIVLSVGALFDNVNLVSLTFFFLVLSAVEFGIGLILILTQNIFLRSISLNDLSSNFLKHNSRFSSKLKLSTKVSF
jgi:NADH:ubiquinone oxidoreductase subunit K